MKGSNQLLIWKADRGNKTSKVWDNYLQLWFHKQGENKIPNNYKTDKQASARNYLLLTYRITVINLNLNFTCSTPRRRYLHLCLHFWRCPWEIYPIRYHQFDMSCYYISSKRQFQPAFWSLHPGNLGDFSEKSGSWKKFEIIYNYIS